MNRVSGPKQAWKLAVPLIAVFAGACAIAGSKAPKLVAFSDGVPANTVAASRIDSGVSQVPVPVTPVTLRAPAAAVHSATRLRTKAAKQIIPGIPEASRPLIAQVAPPPIEQVLHLAKLRPVPLVPVQTVFVMFQGSEVTASGVPVYEIRVWRLTVWHPVVDPEKQIPRKQI